MLSKLRLSQKQTNKVNENYSRHQGRAQGIPSMPKGKTPPPLTYHPSTEGM